MQKRNREHKGGSCRTGLGLNWCSNNWSKPAPLIPDRLSNVFPGWIGGLFNFLFSNLFAAWSSRIGCNWLRLNLWDCGGSKWRIMRGEKAAKSFLPQEFSRWHLWKSLREKGYLRLVIGSLPGHFLDSQQGLLAQDQNYLGGGLFPLTICSHSCSQLPNNDRGSVPGASGSLPSKQA